MILRTTLFLFLAFDHLMATGLSTSALPSDSAATIQRVLDAPTLNALYEVLKTRVDSIENDLGHQRLDRVHHLPDVFEMAENKVKIDAKVDLPKKKKVVNCLRTMKWIADKMHEYVDSDKPKSAQLGIAKLRKYLNALKIILDQP